MKKIYTFAELKKTRFTKAKLSNGNYAHFYAPTPEDFDGKIYAEAYVGYNTTIRFFDPKHIFVIDPRNDTQPFSPLAKYCEQEGYLLYVCEIITPNGICEEYRPEHGFTLIVAKDSGKTPHFRMNGDNYSPYFEGENDEDPILWVYLSLSDEDVDDKWYRKVILELGDFCIDDEVLDIDGNDFCVAEAIANSCPKWIKKKTRFAEQLPETTDNWMILKNDNYSYTFHAQFISTLEFLKLGNKRIKDIFGEDFYV